MNPESLTLLQTIKEIIDRYYNKSEEKKNFSSFQNFPKLSKMRIEESIDRALQTFDKSKESF